MQSRASASHTSWVLSVLPKCFIKEMSTEKTVLLDRKKDAFFLLFFVKLRARMASATWNVLRSLTAKHSLDQ